MSVLAGVLSTLSLTIIIIVTIVLFINTDKIKKDTESVMRDVVDQINDASYYSYKYDKKQEENIMNVDANIQKIKAHTDSIDKTLKNNDFVKGVPYMKTDKLQLGNQYMLSGVGDAHSGFRPDGWLRIFGQDGKNYNGGVAMKNLWTAENAWLNSNVNVNGTLNVKGGTSEHNPNLLMTQFAGSNNFNYIRGETEIRGNTNNIGDMTVNRNFTVNGESWLKGKRFFIGDNTNGDKSAAIFMGGTNGDNDFQHTVIEGRNYAGPDKSELLLFKGNDSRGCGGNTCGPDRIRLRAGEIAFDVFNNTTVDRNVENIVAQVKTDRVVTPKLQLGDKFLLSGVGDAHGNDYWLRLFNKDNTGYYGGLATANLWTQNFINASDIRLKKDVQDVSKTDLEKLSSLEPKKYKWKNNDKPDYGFIAQDIEKVYPDLVSNGPDNIKSVNYQGIIPLVVGNVKDMKSTLKTVIPDDKHICLGDTCITEDDLKKLKKLI